MQQSISFATIPRPACKLRRGGWQTRRMFTLMRVRGTGVVLLSADLFKLEHPRLERWYRCSAPTLFKTNKTALRGETKPICQVSPSLMKVSVCFRPSSQMWDPLRFYIFFSLIIKSLLPSRIEQNWRFGCDENVIKFSSNLCFARKCLFSEISQGLKLPLNLLHAHLVGISDVAARELI